MSAHPLMNPMRALYSTRDRYQGKFQPPVATPHEPIRVIHMRRAGDTILLAIADGNRVDCWHVCNPDDPRLQALAAGDRSQAHSALSAIGREVDHAA